MDLPLFFANKYQKIDQVPELKQSTFLNASFLNANFANKRKSKKRIQT
jgi:hypothetical protein